MPLNVKWPFPPSDKVPWIWAKKSRIVLSAVGIFSKIIAEWTNRVSVYNLEALHAAVADRPKNQPLVTIANHTSCVDDPLIWGACLPSNYGNGILSWSSLTSKNSIMRWTLAASDITFTREWHSRFFSLGRVVPIVRGDGVYQRGMDFVLEKLNQGGWVHTFPEGGINMTNEHKRLKWGVGRLIAECTSLHVPMVLPIWHVGMDQILPNTTPYIPRIGKKATLLVGEPIDFRELLQQLREAKKTPREMRKAVTDIIQEEFKSIRVKAEQLHITQTLKCS